VEGQGSPAVEGRSTSETTMNDISLTKKGEAYAASQSLVVPAEVALALAVALNDPRISIHERRDATAAAIDDLIAFLDDLEGDCDLEPNLGMGDDDREGGDVLDEPHDEIDQDGRDVSWPEGGPSRLSGAWATEDDEEDGTSEPSLGAPEARFLPVDYFYSQRALVVQSGPAGSQDSWARGSSSDCEDEHDGREPDVSDAEPSLGRPDFQEDQSAFPGLGTADEELVDEDGGDILDEPHDDNELDGGDLGAPDWPSHSSEMTEQQRGVVHIESRRLIAQARKQVR
jgi:hypothetical protein